MCESHPDIIPFSYSYPHQNHTITSDAAYRCCLDCLKATLQHVTSIEDPKRRTQCQSMVMECVAYKGAGRREQQVACLLFLAELGWSDQGFMFDHLRHVIANVTLSFLRYVPTLSSWKSTPTGKCNVLFEGKESGKDFCIGSCNQRRTIMGLDGGL